MSAVRPRPATVHLRRQLLARGCSAAPRCPACQAEVAPAAFAPSGLCRTCQTSVESAERACIRQRLEEIDERLGQLWHAIREAADPLWAARLEAERTELEGEHIHLVASLAPAGARGVA